MTMELKWMQCEVTSGMFPTEYLVVVKDTDGGIYGEIFVSKKHVKLDREIEGDNQIDGRVHVYASEEEDERGLVTVLLPAATINNGRYMQVPKHWLED